MAGFDYRVLVVDDDAAVRETAKVILAAQGYEVVTAVDGFDGLVYLRRSLPDIIISDLAMPNMSGFEFLSVVRKRFPQITVIAISGSYNGSSGGVIADAFFFKGQYSPEELFAKIKELIAAGPIRRSAPSADRAPLWVPINDNGYFVVTCTACLRSSSIQAEESPTEFRELQCPFCDTAIRILADKHLLKKLSPEKSRA